MESRPPPTHTPNTHTSQVPVDPVTFKADVAATRRAVTRNTVLIVGSAVSYPQARIHTYIRTYVRTYIYTYVHMRAVNRNTVLMIGSAVWFRAP